MVRLVIRKYIFYKILHSLDTIVNQPKSGSNTASDISLKVSMTEVPLPYENGKIMPRSCAHQDLNISDWHNFFLTKVNFTYSHRRPRLCRLSDYCTHFHDFYTFPLVYKPLILSIRGYITYISKNFRFTCLSSQTDFSIEVT